MGRIFETRKATMFARWNRMAKVFTRITQGHRDRGEGGRPEPRHQPGAAPRAAERARREHAEGQGRGRDQARERPGPEGLRGRALRGLRAARRSRCSSRPRPTTWSAPSRTSASHFKNHGGNIGTTGSVAFQFKRMGVFRLAPEGIDLDALELDLIDHGLEEMGEGTGEKGEKQLVIRCAFESFGQLQAAIEERKLPLVSAESEYVAQTPVELPEEQAKEVLELVDALEQDEDVQRVFHNLA